MVDTRTQVETLGQGQTAKPKGSDVQRRSSRACLVVALEGARPFAPPSRHWLVDIDEVSLGRSQDAPNGERAYARRDRCLRLRLPDTLVSAGHATLKNVAGQWVVQDRQTTNPGSKETNGTFVNGRRVAEEELRDGDVIVVGRTALVFREIDVAEEPGGGARDVTAPWARHKWPEGLWTLSPTLEAAFLEVESFARSSMPVLVIGEPGTGKELLTRAIPDLLTYPAAELSGSQAATA